MRVVLTGLSPTGQQWNSTARSRLAAIWRNQNKPIFNLISGTDFPGPSALHLVED
jgi:hypothetical protein